MEKRVQATLRQAFVEGVTADDWEAIRAKQVQLARAGDHTAVYMLTAYGFGKPGTEITVTHDSSDGLNPSEARRLLELLEAQQARVIEGEAASGGSDGGS